MVLDGQAAMQANMMQMMPVSGMAAVRGIIRQCLILQDILLLP